eukprot:2859590-Amphidinium_carterae.1
MSLFGADGTALQFRKVPDQDCCMVPQCRFSPLMILRDSHNHSAPSSYVPWRAYGCDASPNTVLL